MNMAFQPGNPTFRALPFCPESTSGLVFLDVGSVPRGRGAGAEGRSAPFPTTSLRSNKEQFLLPKNDSRLTKKKKKDRRKKRKKEKKEEEEESKSWLVYNGKHSLDTGRHSA